MKRTSRLFSGISAAPAKPTERILTRRPNLNASNWMASNSPGRRPLGVKAVASLAGSIVIGGFDPEACAPGFMLSRAPRACLRDWASRCRSAPDHLNFDHSPNARRRAVATRAFVSAEGTSCCSHHSVVPG